MHVKIDFKNIGLKLEKIRKCTNMSLEEFSNNTGITIRRLRTIEKGSKNIKLVELVLICNVLNVTIDEILIYNVML